LNIDSTISVNNVSLPGSVVIDSTIPVNSSSISGDIIHNFSIPLTNSISSGNAIIDSSIAYDSNLFSDANGNHFSAVFPLSSSSGDRPPDSPIIPTNTVSFSASNDVTVNPPFSSEPPTVSYRPSNSIVFSRGFPAVPSNCISSPVTLRSSDPEWVLLSDSNVVVDVSVSDAGVLPISPSISRLDSVICTQFSDSALISGIDFLHLPVSGFVPNRDTTVVRISDHVPPLGDMDTPSALVPPIVSNATVDLVPVSPSVSLVPTQAGSSSYLDITVPVTVSVATPDLPVAVAPSIVQFSGFLKANMERVQLRSDRFFAVVNLSSSEFTVDQYSLLSKGSTFCPTPPQLNMMDIERDLTRWEITMRRKEWFSDPSNTIRSSIEELDLFDDFVRSYRIFRPPSKFVPPSHRSDRLDLYISTVRSSILQACRGVTRDDFYFNLSSAENAAISHFQTAHDVIIKDADKGSAIVIMDRDRYVGECLRHLNDGSYRLLESDPTPFFEPSLHRLIRSLASSGVLTQDMASFASVQNSRPGRFYCLPKLHKSGVPGRPVCSCSGTLCENASIIIDWFLKPLLSSIPSYLRDSYDFLDRLRSYGPLPVDSLLVTLDVVALYPSIPHDDGLAALRSFLSASRFDSKFVDGIVELSRFVLEHNFFEFDRKFYLQTKGTAIGTTMAVVYAVIFMHVFETAALAGAPFSPLFWLRFIDDVFMVWPHSEESLSDFVTYLNSINSSIQFTYRCSRSNIDFLDILVSKDSRGIVSTDLFIKETDTHQFLHNDSCHPGHVKRSLPFSQTLRYRRICSSEDRARFHSVNLEKFLISRQYGKRSVRFQIDKAFNQDLSSRRVSSVDDVRVNLILTYHPGLPNVSAKLRELHDILLVDPLLARAFPLPPRVAFRRPKNLRDKIIRARLPSSSSSDFCGPCFGRSDCQLCLVLPHQDSIVSSSGRSFRLSCGVNANCKSVFVVYCITCVQCRLQYVGCTNNFRKRANQHKSIISRRLAKPECFRLYEHFSRPDHSFSDVRFTILSRTSPQSLEEEENSWKLKLNTLYPGGLNVVSATFSNRF